MFSVQNRSSECFSSILKLGISSIPSALVMSNRPNDKLTDHRMLPQIRYAQCHPGQIPLKGDYAFIIAVSCLYPGESFL